VVTLDLGVPLVAAGGITRPEDVRYCLEAGAVAVQVRSLLWTDPAAVLELL
jgi:NAD(P)H-dependent flavin oxidoreductase YrpB (nitropropane dioxygenase family)